MDTMDTMDTFDNHSRKVRPQNFWVFKKRKALFRASFRGCPGVQVSMLTSKAQFSRFFHWFSVDFFNGSYPPVFPESLVPPTSLPPQAFQRTRRCLCTVCFHIIAMPMHMDAGGECFPPHPYSACQNAVMQVSATENDNCFLLGSF